MKRIVFIFCFLAVCLVLSYSQAKVFFVNFFTEKVDVRLGDEKNYIFLMENLDGNDACSLLNVSTMGTYKLYYKLSSSSEWILMKDDSGKVINCVVQKGNDYGILASVEGTVSFFSLKDDNSPLAKICVANGGTETISRVEVGKEWGEGTVFYIDNFEAHYLTNFSSIKAGNYSIFWQKEAQKAKNKYYFYPDDSGNKEVWALNNKKYYIIMLYEHADGDYCKFYDITPQN